MRVIECNVCGELLTAANDEELAGRLLEHMSAEHPDAALGEAAAKDLVAAEAYEATDS